MAPGRSIDPMSDRAAEPEPRTGFQPAGPDPLTLAAARDTGMPGFRIVATAPPASALPTIPRASQRSRIRRMRAEATRSGGR
jgi:hypothetical protein